MSYNAFSHWFRKCFNLVGIRAKIMGIAVVLVLLLASLLIWQVENTFISVLRMDIETNGISLGRYLAARSENLLLTNNVYGLHELLRDTMRNHPELAYLLITDSRGRLVVDSFGQGIPRGLLTFNQVGEGEEYSHKNFSSKAGLIQDVAVPILDGRAGQVRLGMAETGIVATVGRLRNLLWLSTIVVSLIGMAVAYLLATLVNSPLKELLVATRKIGAGQLDYRAPLDWAKDEMGQLAAAFNEMAAKLQETKIERERLLQEVRRKDEMRRYLLGKVISAQEDERLRISRELHDETGQALSSVNLALASLEGTQEPQEFRRRVKLMQNTVTKALEDIHLLARQLRPSVLDNLGLVAAVERLAQSSLSRWGKDIGLTCLGSDLAEVSPEIKIAAYRIIQEALNNALRHSDGQNISVVLHKTQHNILIIVEDDGIGFDFAELENTPFRDRYLGLFGMQERAELLGGKLTIETCPGEGTTVYVELPFEGDDVVKTGKVASAACR